MLFERHDTKNIRGFVDYDCLLPIGLLAFIVGLTVAGTVIGASRGSYARLYKQAYSAADHSGDKKSPFYSSKTNQWYKVFFLPQDKKPTRQQLRDYINSHKSE